jgi:hypothetical protein
MTSATYSMSFTTGTLLYQESLVVARLFADLAWKAVRSVSRCMADNLLQMRTENASQRVYREVVSRLKQLTPAQFDLLLAGQPRRAEPPAVARRLQALPLYLRFRRRGAAGKVPAARPRPGCYTNTTPFSLTRRSGIRKWKQ